MWFVTCDDSNSNWILRSLVRAHVYNHLGCEGYIVMDPTVLIIYVPNGFAGNNPMWNTFLNVKDCISKEILIPLVSLNKRLRVSVENGMQCNSTQSSSFSCKERKFFSWYVENNDTFLSTSKFYLIVIYKKQVLIM